MLFLGGLMLATSIEYWQLHKRIALRVMLAVGVQPRWLLIGFMLPTWVLSMWISNTATTSMMLPIADAVLLELKKHFEQSDAVATEHVGIDNKVFDGGDLTEMVLSHHIHNHQAAQLPEIKEGVQLQKYKSNSRRFSAASTGSATKHQFSQQVSEASSHHSYKVTSEQFLDENGVPIQRQASSRRRRSTSRQEQIHQDIAKWKSDLNKKENKLRIGDEMDLMEFIKSERNPEFTALCKMYLIGIAFGSSFGGLCTITGTSPNVIINGMVQEFFGSDTGLNYSNWIFFATPISIICLIFAWAWLQVLFLGPRSFFKKRQLKIDAERENKIINNISQEYKNLGSIKFAEVMVIIVFVITIGLWITREPGAPGWITFFRDNPVPITKNGTTTGKTKGVTYMSDAQPAILMTIIMFLLPSQLPWFSDEPDAPLEIETVVEGKHGKKVKKILKSATILNWEMVHKGVPWQLFLLLGGGFALAETSKNSGLSDWVGNQLAVFESIPLVALVFIIAFSTAFLTEVTSNGTAATLLLPIYASLAPKIGVHPFYLMLSCTLSCSFAFNLPIATPTNVLIYSKGYLKLSDLIKSGMAMFFVANCFSVFATMTYGVAIFNMGQLPEWSNKNTTFKL